MKKSILAFAFGILAVPCLANARNLNSAECLELKQMIRESMNTKMGFTYGTRGSSGGGTLGSTKSPEDPSLSNAAKQQLSQMRAEIERMRNRQFQLEQQLRDQRSMQWQREMQQREDANRDRLQGIYDTQKCNRFFSTLDQLIIGKPEMIRGYMTPVIIDPKPQESDTDSDE